MNRQMRLMVAALAVCGGLAAWAPAAVIETWESAPLQTVFDGNADCTWLGDIGAFAIEPAAWPGGANVFAGEKAVRSYNIDSDGMYTIVTDVTGEVAPNGTIEWSLYTSGQSIAIQAGYWFEVVLLANTADVETIHAPDEAFAGYKLAVRSGDYLTLYRASAGQSGWAIVDEVLLGAVNVNSGWNFRVVRSADGLWSVSHANGVMGNEPVFDFAVTDTSVDLSAGPWYAGASYRTKAGSHTQKFGFDNFRVVPEPATLSLLALGALALRRRRR
ncbi:MAG: PEP-CTERM sorting domain-containing protein [Planctomycetes bacterium]|nr:PEP-CTERM sorting domain-containing protein [Planctomycetota bacterium]